MKTLTIWKFPLEITDEQTVKMPEHAIILSAQLQGGYGICLWAMVNPEAAKIERTFLVYGTGNPIEEDKLQQYIGTVQTAAGSLVWHIFEKLTQ